MALSTKMIDYSQAASIREHYPDKTIVHCHGVFDLFHHGHLLHLQAAKKKGDLLIVTVTPDRFVNKGLHRPHHSEQKRLELLAHLEIVDHVLLNQTPTAVEVISLLKPHYYVKGPDYKHEKADETRGIIAEREAVELAGGKLVCTDGFTDSSTRLLNQYFSAWDEEQRHAIHTIKKQTSVREVLNTIDQCAELKVLVVGEPIIDSYVFCKPVGVSSKGGTLSAQLVEQEDYAGGSLAIANHLAALGCETTLLLPSGQEPYFKKILETQLLPTIHVEHYFTKNISTPKKTRFLSKHQTQRMFELIDVSANHWETLIADDFCAQLLTLSKNYDIVIIADFGHGLFENSVLQSLEKIDTFLSLNVQTNSGNFGFNPFTKHNRFDYLCVDERELRVATHDRLTNTIALADRIMREKINKPASLTLGESGSIYYQPDQEKIHCPAFFKRVIDTTGSGDAYFAITSLLTNIKVLPIMIPFLGNCVAGLHTQTMGNKNPVSKVDLIRMVKSILE